MAPRLRRSAHFVPGGNERMLSKALGIPADALILDLEDAVTADNKGAARQAVASWLAEADFGGRERVVRINPLDSPWATQDLDATMTNPPDAYLIPKVRGPEDLHEIDELLTQLELRHEQPSGAVRLLVLGTETPRSLLRIGELGFCPRVDALTWGAEDLSAALGAVASRDDGGELLEVFRYARTMTLLAATAAEVQPLDSVYVAIGDLDGLRRECREVAAMGFTGKMTIHPSQVEIVNDAFTPAQDEIARSRELVQAFEENRRQGRMAFRFRGEMVDAPHLARAQALLERARAAGVLADD